MEDVFAALSRTHYYQSSKGGKINRLFTKKDIRLISVVDFYYDIILTEYNNIAITPLINSNTKPRSAEPKNISRQHYQSKVDFSEWGTLVMYINSKIKGFITIYNKRNRTITTEEFYRGLTPK